MGETAVQPRLTILWNGGHKGRSSRDAGHSSVSRGPKREGFTWLFTSDQEAGERVPLFPELTITITVGLDY